MRAATKRRGVIYPVSDDRGEHELQRLIAELLRPMLARFLAERGVFAHAGADQFIYWAQGNPSKRVAPDIYVLPGVDQDIAIRSWKTWETNIVPSFVLELASDDIDKDYEDSPVLYDTLGIDELVIFDPHARPGSRSRRVRWQVYRRIRGRGFVRVAVSQSDRVRSKVLRAWLRAVGDGDAMRVRLGIGPDGDELYPTEAEAERAARERERAEERAAAEQERAAADRMRAEERAAAQRERAATEQERARRVAAEAEVERLRALLAKKSAKRAGSRRKTPKTATRS
ncbi:MAG: Uma2 family endonuclease [Labilithrix sp.]|nr:Uma2 family endonuclease [Labilithrix sp.]